MIPEMIGLIINIVFYIVMVIIIGFGMAIVGSIAYVFWFYPIQFGKIDTNGWSEDDYIDFYLELAAELKPLSKRERLLMHIVTGYHNIPIDHKRNEDGQK